MPRSLLFTNECLLSGDHLSSMDGRFHALLTDHGELQVLWGPSVENSSVIWSDNKGWPRGDYVLQMRDNGQLCIFKAEAGKPTGNPIWCADGVTCEADYYANMQTDGNFVVYRGSGPDHKSVFVWASGCVVRLGSENCGVWSAASTMGAKITLMLSGQPPVGSGAPAVSVRSINTSDPAQRWKRWELLQFGNHIGYAFVNRKTERLLCGAGDKGALAITTDRLTDLIWFRRGEPGPAGYYALAPIGNENFVLNVFGDGPYVDGNQVGFWTWSSRWTENINSTWQVQG